MIRSPAHINRPVAISMTTVLFLLTFVFGAALITWGESYRRQGKAFPSRYGGTSPPSLIIFCGALAVLLALCIAFIGL